MNNKQPLNPILASGLKAVAGVFSAFALLSSPAQAQTSYSASVRSVSVDVSYSRFTALGLASYVGFEYTLTNNLTTSATMSISGTVTSSFTGQVPALVLSLPVNGVSTAIPESSGCKASTKGTNLYTCSVAVPARTTVKRVVYLRAPDKASTNTLLNGTQSQCLQLVKGIDCLTLTGSITVGTTVVARPTVYTGLGTNPLFAFKSAVPSLGMTEFTGVAKGGATTADDRATTRVTIPRTASTTAGYTSSSLVETPYYANSYPACVNWKECWGSDITIPVPSGSRNKLTTGELAFETPLSITLRRSVPDSGAKIDSILVQYTPDGGKDALQVGLCASSTSPRTDGIPCISSSSATTAEYTWTLINLKNGKYWVN